MQGAPEKQGSGAAPGARPPGSAEGQHPGSRSGLMQGSRPSAFPRGRIPARWEPTASPGATAQDNVNTDSKTWSLFCSS